MWKTNEQRVKIMYFHYIAMGILFFSQIFIHMSIVDVYISIPPIMDSIQFQSMQKKTF